MNHVDKGIKAVTTRSDNEHGYATGTPCKDPTGFFESQKKIKIDRNVRSTST